MERFAQIEAEVKNVKTEANLEMSSVSSRLGKTIIELEDIGMVWDGKDYIKDFSYILLRNDRIGIVGPNGAGKSTLMDIIAGKLQPTSGEMRVGQTVKIGYFAQHSEFPDSNMRVLEYIKEANNYIETADGQRISAAQIFGTLPLPAGAAMGAGVQAQRRRKTPSVSAACADDGTERTAFGRTDE